MPSLHNYQKEYHIQTLYTSVWLENRTEDILPKKFHCPVCRCPLFQYCGEVVSIIPGGSPTPVPVIIQCKNKNCGRKYYVHAMVGN